MHDSWHPLRLENFPRKMRLWKVTDRGEGGERRGEEGRGGAKLARQHPTPPHPGSLQRRTPPHLPHQCAGTPGGLQWLSAEAAALLPQVPVPQEQFPSKGFKVRVQGHIRVEGHIRVGKAHKGLKIVFLLNPCFELRDPKVSMETFQGDKVRNVVPLDRIVELILASSAPCQDRGVSGQDLSASCV